MMNAAIGKPYYGCDERGRTVSGLIERVARYAKGGIPTHYAVRPYRGEGNRCAVVKAADIDAHVNGLALIASMEKDSE